MTKYYYPEERIAVVAMGGYFPDAENLDTLWDNILKKKVSIKDLPNELLDRDIFYRPELYGKVNKNDKTYTNVAALSQFSNYLPLCIKYKIPPTVAEHMDMNQHAAIYCVDQAMSTLKSRLPRERTAVILGTGGQGKYYNNVIRRLSFHTVENYIKNKSNLRQKMTQNEIGQFLSNLAEESIKNTIPITEDSAPGTLQNITAARISNIFDFYGPSYTVDAACASSLVAAKLAINSLLNHEVDAVITGGVEFSEDEFPYMIFSGINALSPNGSYPFDERANGFVIGYGGGILILKRLQDAIRDGDNIIALMSGAGQCSDGKGKAIAAPSEAGQVRAIQEAFSMAGYPIDTVEMIEAHGTGTQVGDIVEINALKTAFQGLGASRENYCGVGSIKSNIGHLRYASGAPSMIKTALALQNKILPPTANIEKINPKLQLKGSPFYILSNQKYWQESNDYPRRAGVSSYGFGGADCHIAMEEYRPEFLKRIYSMTSNAKSYNKDLLIKKQEVVFFSGDSLEDMKACCQKFINNQNDELEYRKSVFINNSVVSAKKEWRSAIVAKYYEELKEKWDLLMQVLYDGKTENLTVLQLKGIYFSKGEAVQPDKMAWVFPGQASQYPNMLRNIHNQYASVETFYMQADAIWNSKYGYPVTSLLFGDDKEQLEKKLKDTKNTHPAMLLSNIAMFKVLSEAGVKAEYMIGHSLGEITALYAAGMLDLKSALDLIGARGFSFDEIPDSERGRMVSIKADKVKTAGMIEASGAMVSIANINSADQTVVGGSEREIGKFIEYLKHNNIIHSVLNVSHAFHTELTLKAAESFYNKISKIKFSIPQAKVMTCHKLEFYPDSVAQLKDMAQILKEQIISRVNFSEAVMKLYDKGVRVFIESGPSSVLTNLIKSILVDKDVRVIAANNKKKDDLEAYQYALAELFTCGVDICSLPQNDMLGLGENKTISIEADQNNSVEIDSSAKVQPLSVQEKQIDSDKESVVYSGVSIGLPGTFKNVFSDDNFKLLLEGKNLIELLTDDERQDMLDLNITRLLKTEEGSSYKRLSTLNEVIQLAGKLGKIDMVNDYLLDEKTIRQMTFTTCAGVAAGYEALKDAGIPLVQEQIKTASGRYLPGRYAIPKEMQDDTGIIYANGFETVDPVIEEVSRFIASKFGAKTRQDLIRFYEDIITRISEPGAKKILSDWFSLHYSRIRGNSGEEDIYKFSHDFMAKISSRANNRLAQLIGAGGPNLYVSAACSSTASSVTLAEDMIRGGHASRIIIIGAENTTSKTVMPFIGACFLSNGSATDSSNVFEAAVPFDNRRNGMVLGAGAVGLVIEKECDVAKRGMNGICRIMGTHLFNTAGHQVKIDSARFGVELDKFMTKMERDYGFNRENIASKTVYLSHETYSPKKGGCAMTEKESLESAFGKHFTELKIINTKGMTGHTLGVSIEEAVAARVLQYQEIPPIANYREPDKEIEGLNLSKGGTYNFDYVIRMVSGYGGQGNYHLLKKIASGDNRICDKETYYKWLNHITSSSAARLKNIGRLLTAAGDGTESANYEDDADLQILCSSEDNGTAYSNVSLRNELYSNTASKIANEEINEAINETSNQAAASLIKQNLDEVSLSEKIYKTIADITKYPVEMLDKDMEMEADLGIDTVKQATIFSIMGEMFDIAEEKIANVSQYRTIGELIGFIQNNVYKEPSNKIESSKDAIGKGTQKDSLINTENRLPDIMTIDANNISGDVAQAVIELISEVTKYPSEMLDKDMEMEADLGIDTVKQATILSMLGEKFGIEEDKFSNGSQYITIGNLIDMLDGIAGKKEKELYGKQAVSDSYIESDIKDTNTDEADEIEEIERELSFQIPVFAEESIGVQDLDLKDKNIWVIGNEKQTVQSIVEKFENLSSKIKGFSFDTGESSEELRVKSANFVKNPVDVIIDCSYIGRSFQFDKLSEIEKEKLLYLCGEARFIFYKKLSEIVKEPDVRIACLISVDGCHGYSNLEQAVQEPFFGALSGFYKGLSKEWTKSSIKIIDIGLKELSCISEQTFTNIVEEIQERSVNCEIGYQHGKRMVFKLDVLDKALCKEYKLPENPHFLISGGGNGITAEIVFELACRYKAKFTILGRTQLPDNIEELAALSQQELEKNRTEIYEYLKNSGQKSNPMAVQHEFNKMLKAISVFRLIENVKKSGSKILYIPCDIRDGENVSNAVKKACLENGPVQVIVHGAGVEKSQLINQKSEEEFKEVFSAKAMGLCNLYSSIERSELKAIIGFSSISGRFGNEAQLDYCAANSFINSFMAMLKSTNPEIHALSIVWSGWKDIGMAWANEFVKNNAEKLGIHLIEPKRGSKAFAQMLNYQILTNEVIISKGVAPFIHENMMLGVKGKAIFIDWLTKNYGNFEKIYKIFSVKRDQIIDHHRIGTTPLVPAVVFMEMCAEFHSMNYGRTDQYCFKNIKLKNPLKLYNDEPREAMMIVSMSTETKSFIFNTYGYLESKFGIVKQVSLNSMEVSSKIGDYSSLVELKNLHQESMEKRYAKEDMDNDMDRLKNTINLGSLFMDREKENSIYYFNKNSAVYSVRLPKEQINNQRYPLDKLLLNPAFMDALYQICGFHSEYTTERVFLPWAVEEFGVVKVPRESGEYKAYAKLNEQKEELRYYDVIMLNEKDEVCYYAKNVIMRRASR